MKNLNCSTVFGLAESQATPPAETEGYRRSTEVSAGGDELSLDLLSSAAVPKSEVIIKKPKRMFTADYKLQILNELDVCQNISTRGSILRREGLYASRVTLLRKQRRDGALQALNNKCGRKAKRSFDAARIAELEKQNVKLQKQLSQAEMVIDIQKKFPKPLA